MLTKKEIFKNFQKKFFLKRNSGKNFKKNFFLKQFFKKKFQKNFCKKNFKKIKVRFFSARITEKKILSQKTCKKQIRFGSKAISSFLTRHAYLFGLSITYLNEMQTVL